MAKKKGVTKTKAKRKSASKLGPIVWALDPFSDMKDYYPRAGQFLRFMAEKQGTTIQPAYVLSPDGLNWTGEFTGPWMKRFAPMAEEAFLKIAPELKLGDGVRLEVLGNKDVSLRADAKRMTDYAQKQKSSFLVLHTHARRGVQRVLMGSFAETALLMSRVPVLMLNPDTTPPAQINKVLFATDLSSSSKKAFKDLVNKCKQWGAELILFHKLPDPIEPVVQSGVYMAGGGWISLYQFLEKESGKRRKVCETWASEAHKVGVKTTILVEDQPGFVTDAILKHAKESQVQLVAMSSQVGRIGAVLLGSVARDVARQTAQPLLIYRG